MKRENRDQYIGIIRLLFTVLLLASCAAVFWVVWDVYYNPHIVLPYVFWGFVLLVVLYLIIHIVFLAAYGATKYGYYKMSRIVTLQLFATVCVNLVVYVEAALLSAGWQTFLPIIWMTAADLVLIFLWAGIFTLYAKLRIPPRKLLLVYQDYPPNDFLQKIMTRGDKFHVEKVMNISCGLNRIKDEMLKYDGLVIYDLHSEVRNLLLKFCYANSIRTYITMKISDVLIRGSEILDFFDSPLMLSRNGGLTFGERVIKRTTDIVFSGLLLLITSPVFLITALLIKLYDGGPVFFRQDRCTIGGKVFSIHKFRSMKVGADRDSTPVVDGDKRVTPFGKFLRRSRLDELPQLIDILKGDMSLVGPRPERVENVKKYSEAIPEFPFRLKVKGGLTGYAQVYGKYNTSAYDKLKLDLIYIKNYSIRLDFKLLLKTLQIVFTRESAEAFSQEQVDKIWDLNEEAFFIQIKGKRHD